MPNYSNRNKLDALSEQAGDLVAEINKLNEDTGRTLEGVNTKVRRNQRMTWLVGLSLLADLIVTVVLGFTLHQTSTTADKTDKVTDRLNYSQNVTRQKVLCPLYEIFINSKSDVGRQRHPGGPAEYDKIFVTFQQSYDVIKCAQFKEKQEQGG